MAQRQRNGVTWLYAVQLQGSDDSLKLLENIRHHQGRGDDHNMTSEAVTAQNSSGSLKLEFRKKGTYQLSWRAKVGFEYRDRGGDYLGITLFRI
ncbi:hypothetical protein N7468_008329 [Penicillium chermesinum]|uniref:Uncharacterized protein n=1 Tax=Penicillium chermesinum TaxID=63820 RepID=A0A9W9TI65_9EURO|nr:uncharacterized protein N7468_008329 [Penicillium chermesinum]KAJ5223787.1 hypothetical protein N7468_008329 [Penicillium chermesinum]KAJ6155387.1 hypothetical protein N7470_005953 [Penicillium chermesinum]